MIENQTCKLIVLISKGTLGFLLNMCSNVWLKYLEQFSSYAPETKIEQNLYPNLNTSIKKITDHYLCVYDHDIKQ